MNLYNKLTIDSILYLSIPDNFRINEFLESIRLFDTAPFDSNCRSIGTSAEIVEEPRSAGQVYSPSSRQWDVLYLFMTSPSSALCCLPEAIHAEGAGRGIRLLVFARPRGNISPTSGERSVTADKTSTTLGGVYKLRQVSWSREGENWLVSSERDLIWS